MGNSRLSAEVALQGQVLSCQAENFCCCRGIIVSCCSKKPTVSSTGAHVHRNTYVYIIILHSSNRATKSTAAPLIVRTWCAEPRARQLLWSSEALWICSMPGARSPLVGHWFIASTQRFFPVFFSMIKRQEISFASGNRTPSKHIQPVMSVELDHFPVKSH